MNLKLFSAPATEPVTLAEAKSFLRVETTDDDTLITNAIVAARTLVEQLCWRALITQTWEASLDCFPDDGEPIELPLGAPLLSVTSVSYTDENGSPQTLTGFQQDLVGSRIAPAAAVGSWPSTQTGALAAVVIRYVVGFGNAAAVPEPLKQAVKLFLADLYDNRNPDVAATNRASLALIGPYRLMEF